MRSIRCDRAAVGVGPYDGKLRGERVTLCCARLGDKFLKKIQGLFVADENFLVNFAMCRKFSFVEIPS
jgi:hypothetical protein